MHRRIFYTTEYGTLKIALKGVPLKSTIWYLEKKYLK